MKKYIIDERETESMLEKDINDSCEISRKTNFVIGTIIGLTGYISAVYAAKALYLEIADKIFNKY